MRSALTQADITVAIPSIPPRHVARRGHASLFDQAVQSVERQELRPSGGVSVALDTEHLGVPATRRRALNAVTTRWVAFLDDDDYLYPNHLRVLYDLVTEHDADYAYSWFNGMQPLPYQLRGKRFDPRNPHHTTITVLVRTELAQDVGFTSPSDPTVVVGNEDWRFITECVRHGARFVGTGEITWHFRRGQNTGGMPHRW